MYETLFENSIKKNNTKFEHVISIPVDMVRKLEPSGSVIELKIKDDSIIIKKLEEPIE